MSMRPPMVLGGVYLDHDGLNVPSEKEGGWHICVLAPTRSSLPHRFRCVHLSCVEGKFSVLVVVCPASCQEAGQIFMKGRGVPYALFLFHLPHRNCPPGKIAGHHGPCVFPAY